MSQRHSRATVNGGESDEADNGGHSSGRSPEGEDVTFQIICLKAKHLWSKL